MSLSLARLFAAAIILSLCLAGTVSAQPCTTMGSTTTCSGPNAAITKTGPGAASPYPSTITFPNAGGSISGAAGSITVTLNNVSSNIPIQAQILLRHGSQELMLFDNNCGSGSFSNLSFTLNDTAAGSIPGPSATCGSGTFKPTTRLASDTMPAPIGAVSTAQMATPGGTGTFSGNFSGDPSGAWDLFVAEFANNASTITIGNGSSPSWTLAITVNVTVMGTATNISTSTPNTFTSSPNNTTTLTATVTDTQNAGTIVNGGTVTFKDSVNGVNTNITCSGGNQTVANGSATCTASFGTEGVHSVTAAYNGTTGFSNSTSSPVTQIVNNHSTGAAGAPNNGQQTGSFCNPGTITVPVSGATGGHPGTPANPYASEIFVTGFNGSLQNLTVSLNGITYNTPQFLGLLLVGPSGGALEIMSNGGGTSALAGINVTLDDAQANPIPQDAAFPSGSYRPASYTTTVADDYCTNPAGCNGAPVSEVSPVSQPALNSVQAAAPRGIGTLNGQFTGSPNGTWQLFAADRGAGTFGSIGSWCLNITTSAGQPTTTSVSGSPAPAFTTPPNNSVTLTATVTNTNSPGSPINEGTVLFKDGAANVACSGGNQSVVNGSATCITTFSTEGDHQISAHYNGTGNFGSSTSPVFVERIDNHTTTSSNGNTYTYCNAGPYNVPAGGANNQAGPSGPYPENIFVSNLPGTINKLTLNFNSYSSNFPNDITMLLVGPCQTPSCTPTVADSIDFFSRVGGVTQVTGLNLTFDDAGAALTPSSVLASGTFRPSSQTANNTYGPPAPQGTYQYAAPAGGTTFGSVYANDIGNGTWSLYGESLLAGAFATINGTPAFCLNFTENPPNLSIAKSHTGHFRQGRAGDTYTITVTNNGPGPTGGPNPATVVDTLPTGLAATAISGSGWTCTLATLTCTRLDAIASGASYPSITITVTAANNAPPMVTNSATVSGSGDNTPANNTANDPTIVDQVADMTITKSHTGNFRQGDAADTYTITVSNSGQGPTLGTTSVTDTLPTGLTATSIAGPGWTCTLGTLTCTRSDVLANGASYPAITLTVSVANNAPASVTNSVTVSGGGELNTANDTATDPTTVTQVPDLTITKSHTGNFFQGQTGAAYTITVSNNGAGPVVAGNTVTVTDTLPPGLTATAISGTGWTCTLGTLTCTRADALALSASYPAITLTVNVAANAPASVTNSATVSGGGEVVTNNDTATDPATVNPGTDLTITKTHTGAFTQGDTGKTYTITVNNTGGTASSGTVTVTDTLPGGLTATAISGTGWTCTLSTLTCTSTAVIPAAGSSTPITLTVNVAGNATSPQVNQVAVSGGNDVNTNNNTASDSTVINQLPDLTITKSHTGNFFQGQMGAAYTITVTNSGAGPTSATVTVVDTLPAGLTATALSGTGWTCTLGTLTCTRSDVLANGASYPAITLTVNVSNTAGPSVTNTATVSGGGETNTANDAANDVTTIGGGADLTITKSHTGNFTQGQTGAAYTITVTNSGAASTSGTVTVTDTLPSGLTATAISGTGWTCTLGTLTCTRADALAAAASYPAITLTVNVANNASASVTNSATVSGGNEVNTGNDTAMDVTTIGAGADLTITKSHTGNFFQGQMGATYTITATNSGAAPTNGTVTVVDTLPTGLTATAISGTGWTCTLGTLTCTRADALAAAASYPAITLTVNVANNAPSSVTNKATVSGGGESNTGNDTANDITTIGAGADLTITKSHTGNFVQGQTGASYTITVSNSGAAPTSGTVTVTDTLPTGLTATAISGTGWTCTFGTLTCTRADALAASSSYPSITLTVNVSNTAPSQVTNTATVSGGNEVNTGNDTANDVTTIGSGPDLTITKSHTGNFTQGQTGASYTITVSNSGAAATSGTVTVTDTLPTGLTATAISGTGWTCTLGTLTCTRADALASGSSYPSITLTVNVSNTAPSQVTNTATVSGGGEVNTGNDTANDVTTIGGGPDLTITKTHTGNFAQGQTGASYTITVSNSGAAATSGTVTVTDTLPTGLTATAISGTGWSCNVGTLTCTRADALASSASYPSITLTVNVSNTAPSQVTNTATVSGGGETNTGNDTANDQTTIGAGPDLAITKTHQDPFSQGQQGAIYTITVSNAGGSTACGAMAASAGRISSGIRPAGIVNSGCVNVTDSLPSGLTATAISGPGWSCDLPSLTCFRNNALAAGESYPPITLTVNVANNAPSMVTNIASVTGGGDINGSNNSANDLTNITQAADLTIVKTHMGNFMAGQTGATYSIVVSNSGSGTSSGPVNVVDALPAGLTATAISGMGWMCNLGTLTCTRNDLLVGSSSFPAITLTVNVAANAPSSVTNVATVSGGGENNTSNDTAMDVTNIGQSTQVMVSTSPGGLSFSVDGTTYTSAQTFSWVIGSMHTIATTSPQTAPGTMFLFNNWSDGGAISHTVTASASVSSYVAAFDTQYQLTLVVNPNGAGSITPNPPSGNGFYAAGTTVNLTASTNPGYTFVSWSNNVQNVNGATGTITLSSPQTVTANFTEPGTAIRGFLVKKAGPIDARVWTIQVKNSGPGAANTTLLGKPVFTQTSGPSSCTPTVTQPATFPLLVGNIAPSSSLTAMFTTDFTGCDDQAVFKVTIPISANNGAAPTVFTRTDAR